MDDRKGKPSGVTYEKAELKTDDLKFRRLYGEEPQSPQVWLQNLSDVLSRRCGLQPELTVLGAGWRRGAPTGTHIYQSKSPSKSLNSALKE